MAMRPAPRPRHAPVRSLWLTWALLLACLFPGCEGNSRLNFAVPAGELNVVRGRVFNQLTGRELTGATVRLVPEGQSSVTSANGAFRLDQVTQGSHRIEVSSPGFNTRVQGVLVPHRGTLAMDLGLVPDTFAGTVSGLVVDAQDGNPLPGVCVTVPEQRTTVPLPGGMPRPVAKSITGADGRFALGPVGAGQVTLVFESATHRPTAIGIEVPAGGNADAVFRLLLTSGAIQGTVRSSRASEPLTAAQVSLVSSNVAVLTDARGAYRLGPLFTGTYLLEFNAPGHDRLALTTAVFPGRTTVTDVSLRFNLARLTGTVTAAGGVPLAAALVSIPALNVTTRTGADGRYDFGLTLRVPLPVLPVGLGASAQGLSTATGFVTLTPGQTTVQDFVLVASTGNLIGQLVSAVNNQPVIGAVVTIPAINQGRVTDLFGSFTFFAIPAQVHQVDILAAGFTRVTTLVPVFADRTNAVRFALSP